MEKRFNEMTLIEQADYRLKKAEELSQKKSHLRFQFQLISALIFMLALMIAYGARGQ